MSGTIVSIGFQRSQAVFLLQAVIGGQPDAFWGFPLGARVFRFSVRSQDVGFHVYCVHSFECTAFKIFFHLWHNGGANYRSELRQWEIEQSSERVDVVNHNFKAAARALVRHISGAHAFHFQILACSCSSEQFSCFEFQISGVR